MEPEHASIDPGLHAFDVAKKILTSGASFHGRGDASQSSIWKQFRGTSALCMYRILQGLHTAFLLPTDSFSLA